LIHFTLGVLVVGGRGSIDSQFTVLLVLVLEGFNSGLNDIYGKMVMT
jgi:hypothetical protein